MSIALVLHVLSAIVWVGGMFFAYVILRPVAVATFEPPQRLLLWSRVFSQFFPWVWLAVITLLLTGYGMIFGLFGGMASTPVYVHVMQAVGILMILILGHIYFATFKRLKQAVAAEDWPAGGKKLAVMRWLIGINLCLGLLVVAIASGGRFYT